MAFVPLERQLEELRSCGITMLPERTLNELLLSFRREEYEGDPYQLLLTRLGGEVEAEPWGRRFSDDVWHFDAECVEDHGAYAEIAERMKVLAGDALPIAGIRDHVDVERGTAWLEFNLEGQDYHWDAEVQDDWADPAILAKFADLLAARNRGLKYTYLNLGGQDAVLGAATEEQLACLRKKTRLGVEWLR